ncbi:hypothetical protein MBLNU230_g6610t1 [Neophaeotheca triangularis]
MAIHRGVQSAIFYYLSCAPCTDYNYRKRRKKEARKDREGREALESEQPGLYRHPSPFSTNQHWDADRLLGPIPVRGKKKSQAENKRASKSAGIDSNAGGSNIASTTTLEEEHSPDAEDDDRWNRRPYQRQDEELWRTVPADERQRSRNGGLSGSVPLSRPATARTTDSSQSYHSKRNPAINDLHPPTVTHVQSREDVAWMLQPPPVAAVMHGSEKPTRSRSNSGSSRPSARDSSIALSRQVSERIMLQKLKSSDTLAPSMSRTSSSGTVLGGAHQRHDRSSPIPAPNMAESSADDSPSKKREKRKPKPLKISEEDSSAGSAITVVRRPNGLPSESNPSTDKFLKVASRPQLSTINSDNNNTAPDSNTLTPHAHLRERSNTHDSISSEDLEWRDRAARRSPLLVNNDSLAGLQELVMPSNALKTNPPSATTTATFKPPPVVEARLHVRQKASREAMLHRSSSEETLPPFDSLLAREMDLPRWIEEHTKRDVAQRWSMDI